VFVVDVPERAYHVRIRDTGGLEWTELRDGRTVVHEKEPGAGVGLRLAILVLSVLPIEWLL
jgi:putative cardiolipin synthase